MSFDLETIIAKGRDDFLKERPRQKLISLTKATTLHPILLVIQ
jgi:hypothetical protein